MAFVKAAGKGELLPGAIREFQVNGKAIALANVDGKFFAINGICLHQGGPLGEGELVGHRVICPWHAWEYDVTTGKLATNPTVGVESYPVEVRGEDVYVDLG
jgi:nitrite reductase (NADH) small subunit